ncbi:MAG: hypothetical protein R3F50_19700 [Gammaproteobacteria bacterium]
MRKKSATVMCFLGLLHLQPMVVAQEAELAELRSEIDTLAGVLQEGLELGNSSGFLGIGSGRIDAVYLRQQGVVVEIRSPLANQRNRLSLSALASSLRSASGIENPFAQLSRQLALSSPAETSVLSQAAELAADARQRSMDEIRAIDYQGIIESAIREAYRGARMLRDIDAMDPDTLVNTEETLSGLRRDLADTLRQVGELETDQSREAGAASDSGSVEAEQRLRQLQERLEALTTQARQQATELSARYEQAREEYRQRWTQDVADLEADLFRLLCDYGVTLKSLPEGEFVSVLLLGLGTEAGETLATDRIHVLRRESLSACAAGEFDAETLQQRAVSYDF